MAQTTHVLKQSSKDTVLRAEAPVFIPSCPVTKSVARETAEQRPRDDVERTRNNDSGDKSSQQQQIKRRRQRRRGRKQLGISEKRNQNNGAITTEKSIMDYRNNNDFHALVSIPSSSLSHSSHVGGPEQAWNEISARVLPGIRNAHLQEEQRMSNFFPDSTSSCSIISKERVSSEEECSWWNGLDRLTSLRRDTIDKNNPSDIVRYGGSECNRSHELDETKVEDDNDTRCDTILISPGRSANKRIIDMHRLRDRWWMAVAEHRRRRAFRCELEQKLAVVRIHVDNNDNAIGSKNFVQETGNKEDISDSNDDRCKNNFNAGGGEFHSNNDIRVCSNTSRDDKSHSISAIDHHKKTCASLYSANKIKLLDYIMEQNDDRALKEILELSWSVENSNKQIVQNDYLRMECKQSKADDRATSLIALVDDEPENAVSLVEHAIKIAIRLDKPQLLRTILTVTNGKMPINLTLEQPGISPLMHAAELGREDCASILLSNQDTKGTTTMLLLQDSDGDTALHYCCRGNGDKAMVLTLLKHVLENTKGKRQRQQLSKLITARNINLQTPLHLACKSGRNDLVEIFLTTCKSSLLFKVLSIKDVENQTPLLTAVANNSYDVVVSLIMWRRNHDSLRQQKPCGVCSVPEPVANVGSFSRSKKERIMCPLVWAALCGNSRMIDLLIQFGDQSGSDYMVTEALLALMRSNAPLHSKLNGCTSLMHAGGNPFETINHSFVTDKTETTISVAAEVGPDDIVRSVLSTGMDLLKSRQIARRRDPKLQKQPEAFFRTLESKEESEANNATKGTLTETLFRAYSEGEFQYFSTATVLYEQICEEIDVDIFARLQISMTDGKFSSRKLQIKSYCFLATYQHSSSASKSILSNDDRLVFAEKSLLLLKLPWACDVNETKCFCPWMKRNAKEIDTQSPMQSLPEEEVTMIANDGSQFLVHASVVSEKSAKLASAIRFARLNCDKDTFNKDIYIEVTIPPHFCKLMIQHMYHGSLCYGWPKLKNEDLCRYLLELMVIAEEFLVPSLVQEIEMRLMSSKPKSCFCWNCCQSVRVISSESDKIVAQCLYCVDGNSHIVTANNAMDVLGLTEFLMEGPEYDIICLSSMNSNLINCINSKRFWENLDAGGAQDQEKHWKVNNALVSLKDSAILTILKKFVSVVKNPDFYLSKEDIPNNDTQKQLLLQMCLNELRKNSIIAASYHKSITVGTENIEVSMR